MDDVHSDGRVPFPIPPMTGGNVAPGNVVGRDDFILELLATAKAGNHVLLVDPRRMGKTSALRRLCNEPGEGMEAVFVDVEGVTTIEAFLARLVRALRSHEAVWKRASRAVLSYVDVVEVAGGPISVKASVAHKPTVEVLSDVVASVERSVADGVRLLIVLDEVPLAVSNIASQEGDDVAYQLLQQLRHVRQQATAIGWVFAGSIGFHHVLRSIRSTEGIIGDMAVIPLGPLSSENAAFLAQCLLLGINRTSTPEAVAAMAEVTGGIPFLLHHVAHRLSRATGAVSVDDMASAFDEFARDHDASRAMTHQLTRLSIYAPGHEKLSHRVLDVLAINQVQNLDDLVEQFGEDDDNGRDVVLECLNLLRDDHYLERVRDGWQWRYDVFRRIWMLRRELL